MPDDTSLELAWRAASSYGLWATIHPRGVKVLAGRASATSARRDARLGRRRLKT